MMHSRVHERSFKMSRVSLETLLSRSNRNMAEGTHSVVRESALEVVRRAYEEGINAQISEGHRSNARQNDLYAQGRTKPGNRVTNARAGYSWHNYGIAIDYFLTSADGSKAVWSVTKEWRRVAQIAKTLGFEWGGDWTGFVDYPHLQMSGGLTMAQMRSGRKPNLVSRVDKPVTPQTSKPKPAPSKTKWTKVTGNWNGQPLQQYQHGEPVRQMQQLLANSYYFPDKGAKLDGIDGEFGEKTVDAVKRYQGMHGLAVDRIPGKATFASLQGKPAPSKPKPKVRKLHLPASAKTWRIYNVNGPYTAKNAIHQLTPSRFGGITYDILEDKGNHIYIINTGVKGRVAIYAAPSTGARIT